MTQEILKQHFPDFNLDSLAGSNIPRIRILVKKERVKTIKKAIYDIFNYVFKTEELFILNQIFLPNSTKRIKKKYTEELEILWFGDVYNTSIRLKNEWGCYFYERYISTSKDNAIRMAYIDGCEFARDAEFHGIPKMDDNMENFYFDSNYRALVDVIAWDGIDISSYDKNFLYTIAQHFSKHYKVLTDRIEEFNSRYVTFRG